MKTRNTHALIALAVASMWVAGTGANAQDVPVKLTFSLSGTVQNPNPGFNAKGVETRTTGTTKLATADILTLVTNALKTTYPTGAYLAVYKDAMVVVDKTGTTELADLSTNTTPVFQVSPSSGTDVSSSITQTNSAGYAYGSRAGQRAIMFYFDNKAGTAFEVGGLVKYSETDGKPDTTGKQTRSITASGSVVGYGTALNPKDVVGGKAQADTTVWSGSVSGSGKATVAASKP